MGRPLEGEAMTASEGEWVKVEEARVRDSGVVDKKMTPVEEGTLE